MFIYFSEEVLDSFSALRISEEIFADLSLISWQRWQWTVKKTVTHENTHSTDGTYHRNEVKFHDQIIELAWRHTANNGFLLLIILFRKYCLAANCNSEFLESKRREPKLQKFHTVFKHLKTDSVLYRILLHFVSCQKLFLRRGAPCKLIQFDLSKIFCLTRKCKQLN